MTGFDIDAQFNALLERLGLRLNGRDDAAAMEAALIAEAGTVRLLAQACRQTPLFAELQGRCDDLQAAIERSFAPEQRLLQAWGRFCQWVERAWGVDFKRMEQAIHLGLPLVAYFLPEGDDQ